VASIAFGMGVDCKGVHRTIHFGPSKNIEAFVQETGRAGRDGVQSLSYLLYHGLLLTHLCQDIKEYVKLKDCRTRCLLKHFAYDETTTPVISHLCSDNCAQACKCGLPDCGKHLMIYSTVLSSPHSPGTERNVTVEQKTELLKLLTNYHKLLVMKFLCEHGHVRTLTSLRLLIGF
jgi:superfamily II DNA helicase RecQ